MPCWVNEEHEAGQRSDKVWGVCRDLDLVELRLDEAQSDGFVLAATYD